MNGRRVKALRAMRRDAGLLTVTDRKFRRAIRYAKQQVPCSKSSTPPVADPEANNQFTTFKAKRPKYNKPFIVAPFRALKMALKSGGWGDQFRRIRMIESMHRPSIEIQNYVRLTIASL